MGRLLLLIIMTVVTAGIANASPTIDSLNVQGYMKKANGQAVTDGTYTLAYGVFQNGTVIWGKSYSTTITSGMFSRSLSGVGGDLSALPAGTAMNSDFSASGLNATLNSALLVAGGSGGITVRVYAVTAIDSTNPQFDITIAAVPTAMVAENAKGVVAGSVTLAGLATSAKVSTSAGAADSGKLALLDATGKFDSTFIPTLNGSVIGAGSVGVGYGGTGSTDGSITGTGNITYESAAGSTTTIGNSSTTSNLVLQSGSGGVSVAAGTTGNVTIGAGTTSGSLVLGNASTGAAMIGNTGAAAVTTIRGGSGASGQTIVTSAGTGATAVDITTTGVGGGITIAPEATGNLVAGGGSTSGSVTIGNASTGVASFGNTGAGAVSTLFGGSGASGQAVVTSAGTGATAVDITATGTGGGITLAPNATGSTTVSGGTGLTVSPSAAASGSPKLFSVTGAADTGLTASTEKNDILFNLARTVTFATGALATQRAVYIQAPTYAFAGASTVTRANTVAISGPPVAGTNATLTNTASFVVESGSSGFGATSPTAKVHLGAGTATAGTAPLKFTSGTNLTTEEAGAVEYDGAALYATMDTTHGRGTVPVEQYFRLTADGATISAAAAPFFAGTSNISLASGAAYEIEFYCYFLKTTAATVVWTLTNTAAPTAMNVALEMSPIAGVAATPTAALNANLVKSVVAAPTITTGTLATGVNHYAHFKILLFNGTGSSFILKASTASGSLTPLLGSYWKARRLPANSIGTFQ